jgi:flagellin-like protein
MNTFRKIRKNAKALSPVVASIILIAVTVAVSIAVAAWMGGMTVGFMGTAEALNVGNPWGWDLATGNGQCNITMTNTGGSTVTINTVRVSGSTAIGQSTNGTTAYADLPLSLNPGASIILKIQAPASHPFKVGIPTTITIVTQGNKEFSATGTPPSS